MNSDTDVSSNKNPFVGPVPIADGQPIYGRDRETVELANLVVSKRIVVLFSPSGAGKTSLIQAALLPLLRNRFKLSSLPIIRLANFSTTERIAPGDNRYTLAMLRALDSRFPLEQRLSAAELSKLSVCSYFERRLAVDRKPEKAERCLLVFDQFEELFTIDANDIDAKRQFLDDLGDLLSGQHSRTVIDDDHDAPVSVWALFSMREDRIAELHPYLDLLPTALTFRYRIDCLGVKEAREAIARPFQSRIEPSAIDRLVDDLRMVGNHGEKGARVRFVEPVQLQVVCRELWDKVVVKQHRNVMISDLAPLGDGTSEVERALRSFYDGEIRSATRDAGVPERKLRDWIEEQLISRTGVRTQALIAEDPQTAVLSSAIEALVNAHLLRSDNRNDHTWVELSHDRLVSPVRAANRDWRLACLSPFQEQVGKWKDAANEDKERYLLSGTALADAISFARDQRHSINSDDDQFIFESTKRQKDQQKIKRLILGVFFLSICGLAYLLLLDRRLHEAKNQEVRSLREKTDRSAHFQKILNLTQKRPVPLDGLISEFEAVTARFAPSDPVSKFANSSLRDVLARIPAAVVRSLKPHDHIVWSLVFTRDGNRLISSSWDQTISVQDLMSPLSNPASTEKQGVEMSAIALYEPDNLLASTSTDGGIALWRLHGMTLSPLGRVAADEGSAKQLPTAAFNRTGKVLATAGWDKHIDLWNISNPTKPVKTVSFGPDPSPIQKILFLPAGDDVADDRLMSADLDGTVRIWKIPASEQPKPKLMREFSIAGPFGNRVGIYSAATNTSGHFLVLGDSLGFVHVVELAELLKGSASSSVLASPEAPGARAGSGQAGGRSVEQPAMDVLLTKDSHYVPRESSQVRGLAFSPDNDFEFVSVGLDGIVIKWTLPETIKNARDLDKNSTAARFGPMGERLFSVAFQPGHSRRIAVGGTRSMWLLDLDRGNAPVLSTRLVPDAASKALHWRQVSVDASGSSIAAAGADGRVYLWKRDANGIHALPSNVPVGEHSRFAMSSDGSRLVTIDCTNRLLGWSLDPPVLSGNASGASEQPGQTCQIVGPVFSRNGRLVAVGNASTLEVWGPDGTSQWRLLYSHDMAEFAKGKIVTLPVDDIFSIAFSPGSDAIAIGTRGGSVRLLRVLQGSGDHVAFRWILRTENAGSKVLAVAFSPNQPWLMSGGEDGILTRLLAGTLQAHGFDPRHERSITGIVFARAARKDGTRPFFSSDNGGRIIEWVNGSFESQTIDIPAPYPTRAIALSDDGYFLVTAGDELLAWDFSPNAILRIAKTVSPIVATNATTGAAQPDVAAR